MIIIWSLNEYHYYCLVHSFCKSIDKKYTKRILVSSKLHLSSIKAHESYGESSFRNTLVQTRYILEKRIFVLDTKEDEAPLIILN